MHKPKINLVGIINITPDSFSDGGKFFKSDDAVRQAYNLIEEGADYVELGADSTRPGSKCVGPKEELKRLRPVLEKLAGEVSLIVDTHHASIADFALNLGAEIINDVSGASDPEMLSVISKHNKKIVIMYSSSKEPHVFSEPVSGKDIVKEIEDFFESKLKQLDDVGISREQTIFDTGLGAFISNDPGFSWKILKSTSRYSELNVPLMLACSRKGFLKEVVGGEIEERDPISAYLAGFFIQSAFNLEEIYIRAHNIKMHKSLLSTINKLNH